MPVLKWRDPATGLWHALLQSTMPPDPEVPLPAVAATHQTADITITAATRHVEPNPTCRVVLTNPHASKRMLVRMSLVVWMDVTSNTAGSSLYADIDALSGAVPAAPIFPGTTVAEDRWNVATGQNVLQTANFSVDFWVAVATTATWFASGAKIGGTLTYKMRGVRLVATPIRYEG